MQKAGFSPIGFSGLDGAVKRGVTNIGARMPGDSGVKASVF